jgi:hypothetical protein
MIRWGVTKEEFAGAPSSMRWTRGKELGVTMSAKEIQLHLEHRYPLRDGEPCSHPGCLRHLTHPCEGCGRVGGRSVSEELDPGCLMRGKIDKDGLCSGPCPSCAQERRRREREK